MSKYLKNGMQLVYLDQCVLSRFLEKPENEHWLKFRELVLKGNAMRRLLCPTSLEHLIETSSLRDDDAIYLDRLMGKLSFGWALSFEFVMVTQQIINRLRDRPVSRAQFLEKRLLRPIEHPRTLAQLRDVKSGLDRNNAWMAQGVNELNAFARYGRKGGRDVLRLLINLGTGVRVRKLLAEVAGSLATGRVVVRSEEDNEKVLNWASKVVFELITKQRLAVAEGHRLCQLLRSEGLGFLPTLKVKTALEAVQLCRREKVEPRDQYDITRAAAALPYADVFVTDGGKASAIRELKLDAEYNVAVFSTKRSELDSLCAKLEEIVG